MHQRPRRNRSSAAVRAIARESHLRVDNLILPVFVQEGQGESTPIESIERNIAPVQTLLSQLRTQVERGRHRAFQHAVRVGPAGGQDRTFKTGTRAGTGEIADQSGHHS